MAFNKVFIILALASCALAMPVLPADEARHSLEAEATSTSGTTKVEDSTAAEELFTTVATDEGILDEDESSADRATTKTAIPEELVEQDVAKRSIEEESSDDDLETAAGTNVLRPLFVYRQQVAYRQRVRNANRFRGNRRF